MLSFLTLLRKVWTFTKKLFGWDESAVVEPEAWQASLFPGAPHAVETYTQPGKTPGRVGVCLSGGGSRALTGGMGQLRALRNLKTPNGEDLISQARVLSTVSGGSWVGVTFEYLTPETSDDDYLNRLVADPGRLVPSATAGHSQAETLDQLPTGNIGNSIASRTMGPLLLGIEVLLLHRFAKVPTPFLWQTLIGIHILKPYGLFQHGHHLVPNSLFSLDEETLKSGVIGPNPGLAGQTANLFASGTDRSQRPFLLCNMAMFLQESGSKFDLLAPVQATAFATGIYGRPEGHDFNGKMVGGGGVSSFAFNSTLAAVSDKTVKVEQTRQLALMDIVGTSSAFYAEILENLFATWRDDVSKLLQAIVNELDTLIDWVEGAMPDEHHEEVMAFLKNPLLKKLAVDFESNHFLISELKKWLDGIRMLTPEYLYWPVLDAAPEANIKTTDFADGGDLENTGIASLLSYDDVDKVISFVNSSTPMAACSLGAFDAEGNEIPGTRVLLDAQMPILFGYQPWQEGLGYRLYAGAANPSSREYEHNQVFPPEAFVELLKGFWKVTGNEGDPASLGAIGKNTIAGVNLRPAILRQDLEVVPNSWFGVQGGKKVAIVWNYTNRVKDFYDATSPEVQKILGDFKDPKSFSSFPHYSTFETHLTKTQINLLSSLTAWSVANPGNSQTYIDLFTEA